MKEKDNIEVNVHEYWALRDKVRKQKKVIAMNEKLSLDLASTMGFFLWILFSCGLMRLVEWIMNFFTSYELDSQLYAYISGAILVVVFLIYVLLLGRLKDKLDSFKRDIPKSIKDI